MINDQTKTNGFILSSVSLGLNIFACFISCIVFLIIIYQLYSNHIKREDKITVVLCGHIYLEILIYSLILISMNVRSILGDLYNQSFDSSWCIFSGYLATVLFSMLYMNFLNQAFYRLIRIVYPQNRRFQSLKFYIILPFIEIIVVTCILLCVFIPLNGVTYLPNDHFCYATFTNIPSILSGAFIAYICPFCCILLIYIHITRFIHHQGNIQTLVIKQRQSRDLLIIRRILILVNLLLILGIPAMTLIFMFIITGEEHPLLARIANFPISVSEAGLSVVLLFCIPQLKNILLNLRTTETVTPVNQTVRGTMQMRTIIENNISRRFELSTYGRVLPVEEQQQNLPLTSSTPLSYQNDQLLDRIPSNLATKKMIVIIIIRPISFDSIDLELDLVILANEKYSGSK
ncbi:unnamed protein product [Adineta steineri]|uniref:G-protein coupled receptors family 1 profile domain-containing protein n=1 Tax=Adineta steineri TaxID=433720 RepID=A0A819NKA3_9BILA|nr:unnamed protein product [Adineta steineri]CAF3996076.1 unnamed protein product [Adineta steineri]